MRKIQWTEPMIQALQSLRRRGEPLLLCSEEIGVCYPLTVHKARELGLADRLNSGRMAGRDVLAQAAALAAGD